MMDFKKIILAPLLGLALLLPAKIFTQTISPLFFGQNAWMPDTIGNASACSNPPCILYGKLHKQWANIKNSNTAIVRFGGIAPDKNRPTNFQYIKMIDSIRAKGMEPVIQVPFHLNQYTAQQAAAIVQYVNITKGKNIKYWIIGNEPDLGYSYTTSAQIAAYFRPFASAMKAVDPTILTIGPECAWYNTSIINGLTTPNGPDDITGKDPSGRYYCDIISFHAYAFNGTQTRAQVISKLTSAGGLQDNLIALNARLANCNSVHGRTGSSALRSAITEANIDYQNSSTDNLYGVGANSFIGGQFIAEMLGIGMKQGVNFINLWSVVEGNTTALNIGYIDGATGNRKPLYWHFKLVAENFKGNYVNGTSNLSTVKSFGSVDPNYINVLVMNQELVNNYNYTVRLNNAAVTGTTPAKININANLPIEYSDAIGNQTTVLLTFDLQGKLVKRCIYSLARNAVNNLPPTCVSVSSALPIKLVYFEPVMLGNRQVNLKWATASEQDNNYFTVQRSSDGVNFEDIEHVKGAGTTQQTSVYATADEQPYNGVSYYRLKQTDFKGGFSYSDIKKVSLDNEENAVLIYPNPNEGTSVNIDVKNASGKEIVTKLYDMQGREISFSSRSSNTDNESHLELTPVSLLPKGIYLIVINRDKEILRYKLVVK